MRIPTSDIDRLREAIASAGLTPDGVTARLGERDRAAADRGDYRGALAATSGLDALDVFVRLFVCGVAVPAASVAAALAPLDLDSAQSWGLLTRDGDDYAAGMSLTLYGDFHVLADLPSAPGRTLDSEHVLGVGGASTTLTSATLRAPVGSALDIGTGCGVQALHLSGHADRVTATDLSERALGFAAANARLNGLDWELLQGDMLAPVADRRFDLVVSNPPFVIGSGDAAFTYRDSGREADGVCAELAAAAPGLLNPGGTLQFLANWVHVEGQDWRERVGGWFAGTGCDVWAVQREVTDPLDYVRVWQRDAGNPADPHALAAWLDWFEANKVEGVGFGMITARLSGRDEPIVHCDDIRHQVEAPYADRIADWFGRYDLIAGLTPERLLAARLRLADGVELRQDATLGEDGWEVGRQLLAQTAGMRFVEEVDPLLVAFLGGCGGLVPVRTQIALLAAAHEAPDGLLAASLAPVITHFVQRGFLDVV
ncbi:MAG TPA: methyltransferase [Phytomonospora sp.]